MRKLFFIRQEGFGEIVLNLNKYGITVLVEEEDKAGFDGHTGHHFIETVNASLTLNKEEVKQLSKVLKGWLKNE